MQTNKIKTSLVMVVILCVASICLGKEKDTLEAGPAKLAAANMFAMESSAANFIDTTIIEPEESEIGSDYSANLLGDLAGMRPLLDDNGVIVEMAYIAEFFNNLRGGLNTDGAGEYRGNFDFTLTIDTERLGLLPGSIFFYTQLGHGTSITADHVGDAQTLSNIDSGYLFQISEYWIEQLLFDGRLRVKLGKQDSAVDFVSVEYGGDFSQSSLAVIPTIPMPTFPDPSLGVAVFWELTDWLSFGAGVYEGAPKGGNSGFNTAFDRSRHGGVFSIYEVTLKPVLGTNKDLPGIYRFGGWHHSADFDEVDGDGDIIQGNYGFYLAFDQMLYHEKDDSDQGLGAFVQYGWAPKNRNEISCYVGAGFSYVGLIPGRDEDITGIGVALALWSKRLDNFTSETAIEFFYKIQLTDSVSIKPDIHYIANPGGEGTIKDAVALGARLEVVF